VTNPINDLFARALGVGEPWFVKEVAFDADKREMIIPHRFRAWYPLSSSAGRR